MKLLYLFYKKIEKRDIIEKEKILNLLSKEYRDVIDITFKMKINLKILSEKEIEDIINNNKIKENINDVLWYLCDKRFW